MTVSGLALIVGIGVLITKHKDTSPVCSKCKHNRQGDCYHPKNQRKSDNEPEWSQSIYRDYDCKGKLFSSKDNQ